MKKLLAVLAVPLLAGAGTLATTSDALAQHGIATIITMAARASASLLGGLAAGAIIGGAIASSRPAYAYPPGYYAPGYAPALRLDTTTSRFARFSRSNYWDGYNWRIRNVQVCN